MPVEAAVHALLDVKNDYLFRSDGNSRLECSYSVVLTCLCWYPSQPGVMLRLSAYLVKDSESWNHSDMYRHGDCVH